MPSSSSSSTKKFVVLCATAILGMMMNSSTMTNGNMIYPRHYYEEKFIDWMKEHNKSYKTGDEFVKALEIFIVADDYITNHNMKGETKYTIDHNEFSDFSPVQFRKHFSLGEFALGFDHTLRAESNSFLMSKQKYTNNSINIPDEIDWVEKKMVSNVKNQGQCGSCWAFSTTGALEAAYAIKNNGSVIEFSEQQLVDCDSTDGGCEGGLMDQAFEFVHENKGLCTEESYEYMGKQGKCDTSCNVVKGSEVSSFIDVEQSSKALEAALAQQPVSVAIQANQLSFQLYRSGILTGHCGDNLDHGVLAVGYGEDKGTKFWKVKNSWGSSWGEDGYIRIEKESKEEEKKAGKCGIYKMASYPVVV